MNKKTLIILFLGLFLLALAGGSYIAFKPKAVPVYIHNEGEAQGTFWSATYEQPEGKDLKDKIEKRLHEFDLSLSSYVPQSII